MSWLKINERQWVTIGIFGFALVLLAMAGFNPQLWEVEVFKVIIQAVVLTGLLNMVLAFHFSSNKDNEKSKDNTSKAFDAITAAATGVAPNAPREAAEAADAVADAAVEEAENIRGTTDGTDR